jgi:hypothetical protein
MKGMARRGYTRKETRRRPQPHPTFFFSIHATGFAPGRRYARYKGPYLETLRTADLKRSLRIWSEFFGRSGGSAAPTSSQAGGGPATAGKAPFSLTPWSCPESMNAARERGEENLVYFLVSVAGMSDAIQPGRATKKVGFLSTAFTVSLSLHPTQPNYLRCALAIIVLLAFFTRPLALIGLAGMVGAAAANLLGLFGPPAVPPRTPGGPAPPPPPPPMRALVNLAAYILAAYTRSPGVAFRGGALAVSLIGLHASLLAAPSERALAARTGRPPGVRLRSVLTGRPSPTDPTSDPRRAVRELAAGMGALARAAAAGGKVAAGEGMDRAARWARGVLGLGAPVAGGGARARLRAVR